MASSSSAAWKHDVFLNFRGFDTRLGFTSHLYHNLRRMGVNVFIDNKLEKGEEIWRSLLQEIEISRICVVIFSQNYADSTYCLDELVKIIECRKSKGQIVLPVFYKVDTTDVEELRGSFRTAFAAHEAKFNEEQVKEWKSALQEAVKLSGWPVDDRKKGDAEYLDEIVTKIWKVLYDGKLKRKLQELQSVEAEMNLHVNKAESALTKKQKNAVENWYTEARRIKNEGTSICEEVKESTWTLTLGIRVDKMVQEATEVIEQKGTLEGILDASRVSAEAFPTKVLVGREFQAKMNAILESLSSDKGSVIGIYGMGGVGKTTLTTHVYNKLIENKHEFPRVYWVTMSQDFNVYKLQSLIAEAIGINLGRKNDYKNRAAKLSKELRKKDKFVLIVDDLWNHFDTTEVGIPIEKSKSKLIVTTRSLEVCRRINCKEIKKVVALDKEEAWDLFVKTFERKLLPNVEKIAKLVVKECSGLPLAIVTMAGSTGGFEKLHEWSNALTELQNSLVSSQGDMEKQVFQILRHSYNRLNDRALEQCLLYCALFPEDYEIPMDKLIEYLIVEGIIDEERNTRQEKIDKGRSMLSKLQYVCLLEGGGYGGVKMHDLVRGMAIQIIKEYQPSMVESGKQLREVPNERHWRGDIIRVSLIKNDISEIPSDFSPSCPDLLTLLLSRNLWLVNIPDSFFDGLQGLKVLDLSETSIENLPESFAKLRKLAALFLKESEVTYIPTLADLKCLELLDLSYTFVEKVPEGLEMLSNLRYLNLLWSGIEEFPTGILPKLCHLQFLAFGQPSANAEELGGLRRLETLYWCFPTFGDLITYLDLLSKMPTQPKKYLLCAAIMVDLDNDLDQLPSEESLGQQIILQHCTITREENDELVDYFRNSIGLKQLRIIDCDCNGIEYLPTSSLLFDQGLDSLKIDGLENLNILFSDSKMEVPCPLNSVSAFSLKTLTIWDCSVKKLFSHALLSDFQNLETLAVVNCEELEEIISGEDNSQALVCGLPNLRDLTLGWLPNLRSICSEEIKCGNLQSVTIEDCTNLRSIPICLPIPSLESVEAGPIEWWETVEWGHLDQKSSLPVSFSWL